jgi:hypothetical protein
VPSTRKPATGIAAMFDTALFRIAMTHAPFRCAHIGSSKWAMRHNCRERTIAM